MAKVASCGNDGELYDIDRYVFDRLDQSLELDVVLIGVDIVQRTHPRLVVRLGGDVIVHLELLETVKYNGQIAVRHLEGLDYTCHRTHLVQIFRGWILYGGLLLQHRSQQSALLLYVAHQPHGFVPSHRYGRYGPGKQHRTTERQNGQHLRHFNRHGILILARIDRDHGTFRVHHIGYVGQLFFYLLIFFTHNSSQINTAE